MLDRSRRRGERGAAMVEFAILLPLFLLIIAGIVDFGRAFFTQIALTNAAREGVRYAVINDPLQVPGTIELRAQDAAGGIPGASATVISMCPNGDDPSLAEVRVSAPFDWIVLEPALNLFGGAGALTDPLESTAVMSCGG